MNFSIKIDPKSGEKYIAVKGRGIDLLTNPHINKGTAFLEEERVDLAIRGLLPPAYCTLEQQVVRAYEKFVGAPTNLQKYIVLMGQLGRAETIFYRLVSEHLEEMLPIIYTPVVGEACQQFSQIYRRSHGLYIDIEHCHCIEEILRDSPYIDPSVIVVTDGERILGLGDQGIGGMAISIGKLCLYTICGGINPINTLPIMLDVGTNNEELLRDPNYLGLRKRRIRGEEYQRFIDHFVASVKKVFPNTVLQWEDFLKGNAIYQLRRFRNHLPTFNDDIQGTAAIAIAGIFSALRISQGELTKQRLLLVGAGAAAQGIAELFSQALLEHGVAEDVARKSIWMVDSQGLVFSDRPNLDPIKIRFARDPEDLAEFVTKDKRHISLPELIRNCQPTILIGTTGAGGIFDQEVVEAMTAVNETPVIFALSNPTSKSEVIPEDAIAWSRGKAVVATGSPFQPVYFEGKKFRIGQANNTYIFPGVGLGVWLAGAKYIPDSVFLKAAKAVSAQVTETDLAERSLFPPITNIRKSSHAVAVAVIKCLVKEGYASENLLPNLEERVRSSMWNPEYLPVKYEE